MKNEEMMMQGTTFRIEQDHLPADEFARMRWAQRHM
jgi:hypothetical protein